ncbi:CRISPR-associated protein Csx10 [Gammaproteobacteria bacterium]
MSNQHKKSKKPAPGMAPKQVLSKWCGQISIEFQHYWHCSLGQAGEGDVDLLPVTEPCGLPYIPGRTLRGRLKWTARELGWSLEKIRRLFGREDAESLETMGKLQIRNAILQDQFAEHCRKFFAVNKYPIPEISALFEDIASTSVENGVARDKSLRRVRYTVPVTLKAKVQLEDQSLLGDLEILIQTLRAVGKGKRNGFGWCIATLRGENTPGKSSPPNDEELAYQLDLKLLDNVVFSLSNATQGEHQTLDYIPGSALMGVAAKSIFERLGEEKGALALLRGDLSFGNGMPKLPGSPNSTLPMPLSWHSAKIAPGIDKKSDKNHQLKVENIYNLAAVTYEKSSLFGKQPVQMREGWFEENTGNVVRVPHVQTLKTAVSEDLNDYETAKTSALFGYEAIAAGACFNARVEISSQDPELRKVLREIIYSVFGKNAKTDEKMIRLGKSKNSEFGESQCKLTVARTSPTPEVSKEVVLFAESDLALIDENGFPTLEPKGVHFDLKDWELVRERSYLKFRQYSLWNAMRGSPDVERKVIRKGSVLVFRNLNNTTVTPKTRVGVGQSEGLGRVRVAPPFLKSEHPPQLVERISPPAIPNLSILGTDPFSTWIKDRHLEKQFDMQAAQQARKWSEEWLKTRVKISPSQWGRLAEEARDVNTVKELLAKLGNSKEKNDNTVFGHGKAAKKWTEERTGKGSLEFVVLKSLESAEEDKLVLAIFKAAVHHMAANARIEKKTHGQN